MNCPKCNKPLTDRYKTIWTCDNPNCVMFNAILDKTQWEFIITQIAELLAVLRELLWPNVPSADDFRMLIIGLGGTTPTAKKCGELADRLEEAQKAAQDLLGRWIDQQ